VSTYPIVPAINATDAVLANYQNPVLNNGTLTVKKAPLVIKANDVSRYYGQANNFTYSVVPPTSFKNNDDTNGGVTVNLSTTATATSPNGPYPITVSLSGSKAGNYAFTGQPARECHRHRQRESA
jgi:hypothetical protein